VNSLPIKGMVNQNVIIIIAHTIKTVYKAAQLLPMLKVLILNLFIKSTKGRIINEITADIAINRKTDLKNHKRKIPEIKTRPKNKYLIIGFMIENLLILFKYY